MHFSVGQQLFRVERENAPRMVSGRLVIPDEGPPGVVRNQNGYPYFEQFRQDKGWHPTKAAAVAAAIVELEERTGAERSALVALLAPEGP